MFLIGFLVFGGVFSCGFWMFLVVFAKNIALENVENVENKIAKYEDLCANMHILDNAHVYN